MFLRVPVLKEYLLVLRFDSELLLEIDAVEWRSFF
jgi:hypothetical protein